MSNTFTQIYIHIIIVVKGKQNQISPEHKDELYKYIAAFVESKQHKLIAINGGAEHVHILACMNPNQSISDFINEIKFSASDFIDRKKWNSVNFEWQEGFVAFSVSKTRILDLIEYINKQEKHHEKKSFKEEYLGFLKKYGINFDESFIFSEN